jgi:Methyltransferase domain
MAADEPKAQLFEQILQAMTPLQGWCTPEKAKKLCALISQRQPKLVVESGIFGGKSIIPMALTLRAIGAGRVVGIDPWTVDAALEGEKEQKNIDWWSGKTSDLKLELIYRGFVEAVLKNDLLSVLSWIRAKGEVAARLFEDKSIDFLHTDSNHSELVSCREVEVWAPKLADNAIWVWDDANWESQAKALEMVKKRKFKILDNQTAYLIFQR